MPTLTQHNPDTEHQHHTHRWIILAFLGLAQLMVVLDATIVNIAMPSAQISLHFSNVDRQWLVTAYSLAFGSILLLGGRLSDLLGRKTALQIGLLGFAVASAIGGASVNFGMLVVARAIQGGFGAILAPAALALLTTSFTDPKERGKAFGIYGSIAGAGAAIGLLLGGVLTQYLDWRWTLYVNLIFAAVAIVGTQLLLVRERGVARGGVDVVSTLLIASGLFSIVYGLSDAANNAQNTYLAHQKVTLFSTFSGTATIGFVVVGIALVAAFLVRQRMIERPMLPLEVIRDRTRGGALLAIMIAACSMFAVFLFLSFFLQYVEHYSPSLTGLSFLPMIVVLASVAALVSTKVLPRTGPKPLIVLGMLIGSAGMFLLTGLTVGASYPAHVLPALLLTGAAMGMVFSTSMNTATSRLRPEAAGVASAAVNVTQQVGGAIGTALLSAVSLSAAFAFRPSSHAAEQGHLAVLHLSETYGYTKAFAWASFLFLGGALLTAFVLPNRRVVPLAASDEQLDEPVPVLV
jgi:EmrB/QacA subfamily drug resistance transporter